jgi:hypothetical protein
MTTMRAHNLVLNTLKCVSPELNVSAILVLRANKKRPSTLSQTELRKRGSNEHQMFGRPSEELLSNSVGLER